MRQKEGSVHRGRGNREQGGIQSLAADGQEGISANAGREELEDQQRRTQVWYCRRANGCDSEFLHCLPWSEVPGKVSGNEMGCRVMQTRGHEHSQPQ